MSAGFFPMCTCSFTSTMYSWSFVQHLNLFVVVFCPGYEFYHRTGNIYREYMIVNDIFSLLDILVFSVPCTPTAILIIEIGLIRNLETRSFCIPKLGPSLDTLVSTWGLKFTVYWTVSSLWADLRLRNLNKFLTFCRTRGSGIMYIRDENATRMANWKGQYYYCRSVSSCCYSK